MKARFLAAALASFLLAGCPGPTELTTDRPIPPTVRYDRRINDAEGEQDLAKLRAAAAKGDAWAQGRLAYLLKGEGTAADQEAERWLRRAAAAGDAQALALLGTWTRYGMGVPRDGAAAFALLRKAAEMALPDAEYDVAMIYARGAKAVPKDEAEARYWFVRAARHGHPVAAEHGRKLAAPTPFERLDAALTDLGDGALRWLERKLWPDSTDADALGPA